MSGFRELPADGDGLSRCGGRLVKVVPGDLGSLQFAGGASDPQARAPGVRCVSILPAPVGLPGDSGRRARLRGAQVRVAGPPPRGCVGRGRWAGSGPRVPSPPLPRPPPHLCVSEPGRGSQTRNKSGFPPRGCHLLGFHTSGNGGREPLPFSQCLRPPPARGLGVSLPPSVAGPRGGAGASAAGRGPSGQGRGGSQGEFDGLLCGREVSP